MDKSPDIRVPPFWFENPDRALVAKQMIEMGAWMRSGRPFRSDDIASSAHGLLDLPMPNFEDRYLRFMTPTEVARERAFAGACEQAIQHHAHVTAMYARGYGAVPTLEERVDARLYIETALEGIRRG